MYKKGETFVVGTSYWDDKPHASTIAKFRCLSSIEDPEAVLRTVVEAYLEGPEGPIALENSNYDFNWGDAFTEIPDALWQQHGLKLVRAEAPNFQLEHDEVLAPERDDF